MKKHLIVATYDGIGTHYSGVGTIAKNIVNSLIDLADANELKVSIAYIDVDKQSKVFNEQCYNAALFLTAKTGGLMIPLCNGTKGQSEWDMWRSFNEWKYADVSLVTALNLLLDPNEHNYIILNDTPFLFFAKYKDLVHDKSLTCFYFPLSTGKNHAFGDDEWRNNRIRVEQMCFDLAAKDNNSRIIALGKTFAERLSKDYGLAFGENDFLQNGLCFDKYQDLLNMTFTNRDLKKFGIELEDNKKIVFAWGRCSIAKGFKELALAWSKAHARMLDHYLILQMPNNSGELDYFKEVQAIAADSPRCIVIDDFNPEIWKVILRTGNTEVVCIPSLMDPFPHTSIEAKLFSKGMNYITIISDVDGAVDAFSASESFHVDPRDTESFAQKIVEAATMHPQNRRQLIDRNLETVEGFNFPRILEGFIKTNLT